VLSQQEVDKLTKKMDQKREDQQRGYNMPPPGYGQQQQPPWGQGETSVARCDQL